MSAPLLLDLSHTSHTRARTGIQRVARSLHAALGDAARPITFDPHLAAWRELQAWERANLGATAPGAKRGAAWPLSASLQSRWRRITGGAPALPTAAGLIVPELFSAHVAAALPPVFKACHGPRVAVFHDAIALKLPEMTPAKTVARFPAYLQELLAFDGIAAVSEDSKRRLVEYWQWLGIAHTPPVRTIPLGIDPVPSATHSATHADQRPVILSVGSIEGRKNHLALLEACDALWASGAEFELHLLGLGRAETAAAALQLLGKLRAAGRSIRHDDKADDEALHAAYRRCTFTVYPSLLEGFGLPVLESIAHGKPCICSAAGALGESAAGGGCMTVAQPNAESLRTAIARLLGNHAELATLAASARSRRLKTWSEYASELTSWMQTLERRS